MTTTAIYERSFDSPLGRLRLLATDEALVGLYFPEHTPAPAIEAQSAPGEHAILDRVAGQLEAYFSGRRRRFELPLAPAGTEFQREVWAALVTIEPGTTATYAELAARIGRPAAVRAVGAANGRNPISIVVPCHRVIGSDGRLTGYAGGLARKRWLLDHEAGLRASAPNDMSPT